MKIKRLLETDFYKRRVCDLIYCVCKIIERVPSRRPVWMVCERGDDACDNGLWMFRYLQDNHPEIESWYVITESAPDRKNLEKYKEHVVTLPSVKFYWLLSRSRCLLAAQCRNYLHHIRTTERKLNLVRRIADSKMTVRIQHGIIMNDMSWFVNLNFRTDIFICGAKPEYEYVREKLFYPLNVIKYTGLARYDGLHDFERNSRSILLMPTWRHYITNAEQFFESEYFKVFQSLLCNDQLHGLLKQNHMNLVFNIHPCFRQYICFFKELSLPECIYVADYENDDIQTLLKKSAMIITDYSSVAFDMAYMYKPVCYFQFDESEFRAKQFAGGYYNYRDGLGSFVSTVDELLACINIYMQNGMTMLDEHRKKVDEFFVLHDRSNCKRVYDETIKLLN